MRKALILLAALAVSIHATAYSDHRGHNLDSLERAVARWTPDAIDRASEQELIDLNRAYRDLMVGYHVMNGDKCVFYARRALSISHPRRWHAADADAYRYIGQDFYGREQYDSAMVYYKASLAATDAMAAGAVSPTDTAGYSQRTIDDHYSALYGSIGNLYNMMDSIPQAMDYYEKAGAIFEKYGWNESNSILHYNMGETWIDEGELGKARAEYDKAMAFAEASGDSLMIVDVWKGYGRLYAEQGKTWKSLPYLRKADAYYAAHPDYAPGFRTENLGYMQDVLSKQKLQLGRLAGALTALLLVLVGVFIARRKKHKAPKGDAAGAGSGALRSGSGALRAGSGASAPSSAGTSAGTEAASGAPAPSSASARMSVSGAALDLSAREKEILDLLSKGYTAPQIAEALSLSSETIRWYRKKLLAKLDVSNTAELISTAKDMGLI